MVMLKGCDEWRQTNASLLQLQADVKYQIDRVGQREIRLQQVEQNLTTLFERTQLMFEQRRDQADKLVHEIDERLDRLERYMPDRAGGPR